MEATIHVSSSICSFQACTYLISDSEKQKEHFKEHPEKYLRYIKMIESELNQRFKFILNGTLEAQQAKEYAIKEMTRKLSGDKELCEAIIPKDFGVGCRRPTVCTPVIPCKLAANGIQPGSGFLEALTQDNVKAFTRPMQKITPTGFVDDEGIQHDVDIIICATGYVAVASCGLNNCLLFRSFDTSWVPRFPIVANGIDVRQHYKESTDSYFGVAVPGSESC